MAEIRDEIHPIWRAAIASALGPLSAYMTPENFGLSLLKLEVGGSAGGEDAFDLEIRQRIDLGRATSVAAIITDLEGRLPHSYRHSVHYSEDRVDGVLVVPLLVRERAAGRLGRIPVLRAARFIETPEALLGSELIRTSIRVAESWRGGSGAERSFADKLSRQLRSIEGAQPWSSLRARPRASLWSLAGAVKSRAVAGWTQRDGAFEQLADLVLGSPNSVLPDAGPIAFLVSEDDRFEDRVFELVCLGWLLAGLKKLDPAGHIEPRSLKSVGGAVFSGTRGDVNVRLHYQAGYFSKSARYHWQHRSAQLRAIPDYSLELEGPTWRRSLLLDAKNRRQSGASEVIYKMLGYQENLNIKPYLAVAIAPGFDASIESSSVKYSDKSAYMSRVPLLRGRRIFERMMPKLIDSIISEQSRP